MSASLHNYNSVWSNLPDIWDTDDKTIQKLSNWEDINMS